MAFRPRQQAAGNFTPVPEGAHIGVCSGIVDLGLQGGGKYEPAYKVVLSWQLPNALTDAGKPMTISQTYTNSMNKKANLRKTVEAWFGKTFPSEDAANEFDLKALLGRACMVNVIHKANGEKTYANVTSVMQMPAGIPKPTAPAETLYYAPTDDTQTAEQIRGSYAALPDWIRKRIDEQMVDDKSAGVAEEARAEAEVTGDDIPF